MKPMSKDAPERPATYEDLCALPEHVVGEIIDGELVVSPRPAARHASASSMLGAELLGTFGRGNRGGPGGWVILDEPELHVVGQVMVPDLAGWRRERMPQVPDVPYFELAPDWLCEVLSPSTAARDRTRKMRHYLRAGVGHVWLVDPGLQTLEVFRLDGETWRLVMSAAGDTKVRAEPFDAAELDLAVVWAL
jgi:Uma2 family endonuclease